jgi:site-specific DNA-adenine methylase
MSYQGGKQKLGKRIYEVLDTIEEYFEEDNRLDYLEPFVGFCGVMKHFASPKGGERKLTGCDSNKDVIAMWKATQRGWKPPITCTKKRYEELKNSKRVSGERGFIGVACSYSGIFFVGYRGTQTFRKGSPTKRSGSPTKRSGSPTKRSGSPNKSRTVSSAEMTARSVNKIAKMVKNVKFKSCNYQDISPKNMLIYCDPPYASNDYQQSSFFDFDSDKFWKIMKKWSKDNIVVVSEYKAPKDFKMIWQGKTNVMHNGKKNIKTEKLFVYKDLYDNMDAQLKRNIKKI